VPATLLQLSQLHDRRRYAAQPQRVQSHRRNAGCDRGAGEAISMQPSLMVFIESFVYKDS